MRQFIYKMLIVAVGIVLVYEFTIGKQIALFKDRADIIISKEGRRDGVDKLRVEIQKAINKERYLSREDAILINKFINKIQNELAEAQNQN
tara:strand:+ start:77 stop:349 length:273 start_codon:yes stop_codon:yes gene_type:complete